MEMMYKQRRGFSYEIALRPNEDFCLFDEYDFASSFIKEHIRYWKIAVENGKIVHVNDIFTALLCEGFEDGFDYGWVKPEDVNDVNVEEDKENMRITLKFSAQKL